MRRHDRIRHIEGTRCRTRIAGRIGITSMRRRHSPAEPRRLQFDGWKRITARVPSSSGLISSIRTNRGILPNISSNATIRITRGHRCYIRTTGCRPSLRMRNCTISGHTTRVKPNLLIDTSDGCCRKWRIWSYGTIRSLLCFLTTVCLSVNTAERVNPTSIQKIHAIGPRILKSIMRCS